jgi:hypothetical protein
VGGREGEWATRELNRVERGRSIEKEGQQGAGAARAGREKLSWWGKARANARSSLADFSTVKMEATRSFETSVQFTRSTPCHIPEDVILHYREIFQWLPENNLL